MSAATSSVGAPAASINKIGKSTVPRTAICTSDEHSITVRGEDLCQQLIGHISFTDYFSLLVTGQRPSPGDSKVLDATLVAIAEHGLVPSVQASRMTYAAAPDALQGAVAEASAREVVTRWRTAGKPIPGYGHPLHKDRDPRVARLFAVAKEAGTSLRFIDIAEAIERVIPGIVGKDLRLNVSAAIPAVLLGTNFPLVGLRGVPILARTAGLIAHLCEEAVMPSGFALSYQATREVVYEGKPAPHTGGGA